ncbi:helix-turn-helix domain-containing protein [Solimonas variicoloris]|uniref:helix-turn-helix domain-containing protein n=1 Tax=Solimonas variicoloris TaxID=254408 RepID=UPI00037304C5|nr:helix-turn-helix transcriptional regulator [Solimonas variicoloris]
MSFQPATHGTDLPDFGTLLRENRRARRLSQLGLALQAEVSQRHLSFLESGRAQPSRDMVLQLAETLDLPLRERNRLLLAAGYAGIYPQRPLEAPDMQPALQALDALLRHHEPYPAAVVDRAWNVLRTNAVTPRLLDALGVDATMWHTVCGDGPRNLLKLTLHEHGLRPYIANLDEVAPPLLARTAREALEHPALAALLDEVLRYPGLPRHWRQIDLRVAPLPVLPTEFRAGTLRLRLFSMLTTFGTPLDVTTDELRVESFFPADADSETLLRTLAGAAR